jgi:iron complex transport system ATP-binding protein
MSLILQHNTVSVENRLLFSIDRLAISKGSMVALLGKNGSGKSTFLRGICGFNQHVSGEIDFFGCNLIFNSKFKPFSGIAYVPVKQPIFGRITLLDVVLSGRSATRNFLDIPSSREQEEALDVLSIFSLNQYAQSSYVELSDGEQKMGLVARAIFQNAAIILLDEPEAFLDVGNRARMFKELRKLADSGKIIILSTHQPQLAMKYCDEVAYIQDQKLHVIKATQCTEELVEEIFY